MKPVESRVVANGLEHHVITWAAARPSATVVLCHGFLDLGLSWDRVARRLVDGDLSAIAFDWRGHGDSQHVGAGGYYHFPDYVLDLAELLPKLAGEPPHLVGHSMGGTVCALFAGTRPKAIRSLTLIEGIGPPEMPRSTAPDRFAAWLEGVPKARGRAPRVMKDVDEVVRRMRVQNPGLDDELGRALAEAGTRQTPDGRVWSFDPLHRTTSPIPFDLEAFEAFLERIEAPTLVVGAEHGFRLADEAARVAKIPNARLLELGAVGHMVHWLAPDRLASALIEFVRSC